MQALKHVFRGPRSPWSFWHFIPWSRDKFNNQLQILAFFSLVPGQVQQPITYFRRPWDDFMVHGVNKPFNGSRDLLHLSAWREFLIICPVAGQSVMILTSPLNAYDVHTPLSYLSYIIGTFTYTVQEVNPKWRLYVAKVKKEKTPKDSCMNVT